MKSMGFAASGAKRVSIQKKKINGGIIFHMIKTTSSVMDSYSEPHRILLTYILAVKAVQHKELLEKFQIISQEYEELDIDDRDLSPKLRKFISIINSRLEKYSFKIDELKHQITGESYFVFITTKKDDFIKGSTTYSPPELDSIKTIIEEIIDNDSEFSIGIVNANQTLVNSLNRSQRDAYALLTRLIDDGWFELTTEDKLILSIRSLSDLKQYLIDSYGIYSSNDVNGKILQCKVCSNIVTLGYKCKSEPIDVNFHYKCLDIYNRQMASNEDDNKDFIDTDKENLTVIGVEVDTLKISS